MRTTLTQGDPMPNHSPEGGVSTSMMGERLQGRPTSASVRASVERGDPLAVLPKDRAKLATMHGHANLMLRAVAPSLFYGRDDPVGDIAATAHPPESDPPQPIAADPETLDTQADGDYLHGVHSPHPVDCDQRPAQALASSEAHRAGWSEADRLAFLARVQRIDPRERKP